MSHSPPSSNDSGPNLSLNPYAPRRPCSGARPSSRRSAWFVRPSPTLRRYLLKPRLDLTGSVRRLRPALCSNDRVRPILLNNSAFTQRSIAANAGGEVVVWGALSCLGDAVSRRFRSPCSPFLVLPDTTTSPFVVGSARLPPAETRREHHSVHAIAVAQA